MHETDSIKSLAFKALERLERNKSRNKSETKGQNVVSRELSDETKNDTVSQRGVALLRGAYEERFSIAYYDGGQSIKIAKRMSYLENFTDVLIKLPYEDDRASAEGDWLEQRIRKAKDWLEIQGIEQSS